MSSKEILNYSVAGLMLLFRPENFTQIKNRLQKMAGVDIHITDAARGRMVVTVEEEFKNSGPVLLAENISIIQQISGVLSATLVYSHSEPLT